MTMKTIAVLSPGEMGNAFGGALKAAGFDIITCLAGRSGLTRQRAADTGFRDTGDLEATLNEADLVLSILPPEFALDAACAAAAIMKSSGAAPLYVDCNAVAPATAIEMSRAFAAIDAKYIDGGIVGNPPGKGKPTRLFVSGEGCELVAGIGGKDIDVRPMGVEIGRASGIKMCYAGVTKGTNALHVAAQIAAEALGVTEALQAEFGSSAGELYKRMVNSGPRLPSVSGRFVGEMEEIAKTFRDVGVTPHFHLGAAELFRVLASTPFAAETPDTIDFDRTLAEAAKVYLRHLPGGESGK
jgi:3-hydroxyisobutyrate dehydrogenase-like beta-hydroxyacid dehydrogenase